MLVNKQDLAYLAFSIILSADLSWSSIFVLAYPSILIFFQWPCRDFQTCMRWPVCVSYIFSAWAIYTVQKLILVSIFGKSGLYQVCNRLFTLETRIVSTAKNMVWMRQCARILSRLRVRSPSNTAWIPHWHNNWEDRFFNAWNTFILKLNILVIFIKNIM